MRTKALEVEGGGKEDGTLVPFMRILQKGHSFPRIFRSAKKLVPACKLG